MSSEEKLGGIINPNFTNDKGQVDPLSESPADKQQNEVVQSAPRELTEEEKQEKKDIIKTIVVISIAFVFLFTAYNSMANLQSSINETMGTASVSTIYAALVLSCCFVPSWMIKRLKEKYTLALCMSGYSLYIAAQFYPRYWTLIPSAVVLGMAAAPMWSAKCTYLTKVATRYAQIIEDKPEVVITRFFGIFFFFFQSTQVWGNLISSLVLSVGTSGINKTTEELEEYCGVNFCPDVDQKSGNESDSSDGGNKVPHWQLYTMSSIYLAFALLSSVIILLFVKPLHSFKNIENTNTSNEGRTGVELLLATFNHMRHPYQLLIFPLTIWSGVEQTFLQADFTAAYVTCGLGVHMLGYVLICYGVCDAIGSMAFTPLVRKIGRVPVFIFGFWINVMCIVTFIYWTPNPDQVWVFFILAGAWGVADSIWQTQINAFYGVIFPGESEAAFSNYRLWESLGFVLAFACSTFICVSDKIIMNIVFLVIGIVGYLLIEIIEKRKMLKRDSTGAVIPIDKLLSKSYTEFIQIFKS